MSSLKYRRDIDGLRAIAVLLVVLFHGGVKFISGGFIGVDVFFVISGYLITSIILSEIRKEKFSIVNFWERRVRRIFPALFFMLAVITVLCLAIQMPRDLKLFSDELFWSSLFAANIHFFQHAGYFNESILRPLLHVWSLAVEEQFYLLMPLFLIILSRFMPRFLIAGLLLAFAVSFAGSVYMTHHMPGAGFYLLPSRAWELLTGALLAAGFFPRGASSRLRGALSWIAVISLIGVACIYSSATPFPGLAAVIPCFASAVLLWACEDGHQTRVGKLLSTRGMIAIGLISYSLYLWHWPLLILGNYFFQRDLSATEAALIITVSFAMATFSYHFIEQPFRRREMFADKKRLFIAGGLTIVLCIGFAKLVRLNDGFPARINETAKQYASWQGDRDPRHNACFESATKDELCIYGDKKPEGPDFIVWGDSYTGPFLGLIDDLAKEYGQYGIQGSYQGCPPLIGVERADSPENECVRHSRHIQQLIEKRPVKTVIMIARWSAYSEGRPPSGADAHSRAIVMKDTLDKSNLDNRAIFKAGFNRTIDFLHAHGVNVYVMEETPEALVQVPTALALHAMFPMVHHELKPSRAFVDQRQAFVTTVMEEAAQKTPLTFIPTHKHFCNDVDCVIETDGKPVYRDVNHLSRHGADLLKPELVPVFEEMARKP